VKKSLKRFVRTLAVTGTILALAALLNCGGHLSGLLEDAGVGTWTLSGTVYDGSLADFSDEKIPVAGAEIKVYVAGEKVAETLSEEDGTYILQVPDLDCVIEASAEEGALSYKSETIKFNGDTTDYDIILTGGIIIEPIFIPVEDITGVPTGGVVGDKYPIPLSPAVIPADATNTNIKWTLGVNSAGAVLNLEKLVITTTKEGSFDLTATIENGKGKSENFVKTFSVRVTKDLESVTDITDIPTVAWANYSTPLTYTVEPSNATNKTAVFTVVSDGGTGLSTGADNVVGDISAKQPGTVTLKATIKNAVGDRTADSEVINIRDYEKDVTVTVKNRVTTDILLESQKATSLKPVTLIPTVLPENASQKEIVWTISGAGTTEAVISGEVRFYAKEAGAALVKATIKGAGSEDGTLDFVRTFSIVVENIPVSNITGGFETETTLPNGSRTIELSATVEPSDATHKDIVWSVSSAGKTGAKIDGTTLSFSGIGSAVVTATIERASENGLMAFTKDFTITVNNVDVTGITDIPGNVMSGAVTTLAGTVAPADATSKVIVWSLVDAGTTGATLTGSVLTTPKVGTLTLRATIANGKGAGVNYTQDFNIMVGIPVTNIVRGFPAETTLASGRRSIILIGTVVPSNATNQNIIWSISDAGTTGAVISSDNMITFTGLGTAKVKARIENAVADGDGAYEQEFSIVVTNIDVTGITGIPDSVQPGTVTTLSGTVAPANATSQTIQWSLIDAGTGSATLSGSQLTTPKLGVVKVRATIANGKGTGVNYTQDFNITVEFKFNVSSTIAAYPTLRSGVTLPDSLTPPEWTTSVDVLSGTSVSYEWLKDGSLQSTATKFKPTVNGTYQLKVTGVYADNVRTYTSSSVQVVVTYDWQLQKDFGGYYTQGIGTSVDVPSGTRFVKIRGFPAFSGYEGWCILPAINGNYSFSLDGKGGYVVNYNNGKVTLTAVAFSKVFNKDEGIYGLRVYYSK